MNSTERRKRIVRDSFIGIVVNIVIALAKIIVGMAVHSLAIVSEGINNATDSGSSFLTLVGTKLSSKHPDSKHPFGYGRIEYLTSLTVSILILYTGISLLVSSVKSVINPAEMDVNIAAIILVAVSAVIKFLFGMFCIREGETTESLALIAVGKDSRGDSLFSIVTIGSAVLYLLTGLSADAYVGVLFAIVIGKSGFDILKDTISELIGRPGEGELAEKLYKKIRRTPGIINAADMMLHNYGPDSYSGSVNIEIDHKEKIGDIYEYLHQLQLDIMHEYNVTMVFGIYAVDNDNENSAAIRSCITKFVRGYDHVRSYHAIYMSDTSDKIYCDLVVDYKLKDWDKLREDFLNYMKEHYPDNEIELTIETEYV